MEKVVVAYSGGLDTSYCVKYLQNELNLEVHSALVNTGGFTTEELKETEKKAYEMGVASHVNKNILEAYYNKAIKYMIFGNVLKNNTYPLSVSAERVFQAIEVVKYAKEIGAKYIAHGSTGAGNDQVRFDMIFQTMTRLDKERQNIMRGNKSATIQLLAIILYYLDHLNTNSCQLQYLTNYSFLQLAMFEDLLY